MTLLFVPASILAGHALQYVVMHPAEEARHGAMLTHAHPQVLGALALALALVGLFWSLVRGAESPVLRLRRLLLPQFIAFSAVEVLESVTAGGVAEQVLHDPRLWLAAACQLAGAAIVVTAQRGARRIGAALALTPARSQASPSGNRPGWARVPSPHVRRPGLRSWSRRGPPSAAHVVLVPSA